MEQRYLKLKSTVRNDVEIEMRDRGDSCQVTLIHRDNEFYWVRFDDSTITLALDRAIAKLEHPEKDYTEKNGQIWRAVGSSVYSEEHIRGFLKHGT